MCGIFFIYSLFFLTLKGQKWYNVILATNQKETPNIHLEKSKLTALSN